MLTTDLRVCRVAVIINDVVRDPIHLALVYLSLPLYRSHFTHHDAPASVRRAYTVAEMHQMLAADHGRQGRILSAIPFFAWERLRGKNRTNVRLDRDRRWPSGDFSGHYLCPQRRKRAVARTRTFSSS